MSEQSGPPYVHTFVPSREFMTADEIAAQISAEHDAHVDCVHAVLEQLADWWDTDTDRLVRLTPPPSYTIETTGGGVVSTDDPDLSVRWKSR